MAILLLILSALALAAAEKRSFENYKLVSVIVRSKSEAVVVREIEQLGGDLWASRLYKGSKANILLSPELFDQAIQLLASNSMTFWVLNENIQQAIDEERMANEQAKQDSRIVGTFARYADVRYARYAHAHIADT